jgi:hypothetical protein
MESSHALSDIYQLRIVMRGISPLIWRRLLVRRDTTLAQLHHILPFLFDWSGEHLHEFHLYGRDYGSNGADTRDVRLSDFRLHPGERFWYVYDFGAYWQCDIRLETSLPADAKRLYPVCIGGKGAAPLEDVLPMDEPLQPVTIRNHVIKLAERLEEELGDEHVSFIEGCPRDWGELPIPDGPLTIEIDGGYVKAQGMAQGWFEVMPVKVSCRSGVTMNNLKPRKSAVSWSWNGPRSAHASLNGSLVMKNVA